MIDNLRTEMSDLRTRIQAIVLAHGTCECGEDAGTCSECAYHLADAVIRELGLETQCHYDPDCDYYRYVTDWINPVTGNKIDLP